MGLLNGRGLSTEQEVLRYFSAGVPDRCACLHDSCLIGDTPKNIARAHTEEPHKCDFANAQKDVRHV